MQRIKNRVNARIALLIECASLEYGILIPKPVVQYRLRGDTAGAAYLHNWIVDFNPTILKAYEDEFIHHTVGHEVAHFVSVARAGMNIFPHGREWQSSMRCFELPPRITHHYAL